jgi:ribosomal protein S12 methylthiotransferase
MNNQAPKIGFVSLGCPKNLVDSERILTQLRAEGYHISPSYDEADLVIVNTCGFINEAVEESLEAIGEAIRENGRVIVTGCLGVREKEVRNAHPGLLAVTGPHAYEEVMGAVHNQIPPPHDPYASLVPPSGVRLTPRHYAYLKISEGCSHRCSFCVIPQLRGDLESRPIDEVLQEAENLVNSGVRELLVVSQDTGAYGQDLKYAPAFWGGRPLRTRLLDLANALGELEAWVRLHYIYPYPSIDDLLPLMQRERVLPYLDIPLQHSNSEILRRMGRPAAAEKMLDRIKAWRDSCPEITLRSTFIVGFPGETEAQFEELLEFLQLAQLDRVGGFAYSPVAGAEANKLPEQVPEEIKQQRLARFMALQAEISAGRLARKIGSRMVVLVDHVEESSLIARSAADAPEIDGRVIVDGAWDLQAGDFVEVEIIGADEHDLFASPVIEEGQP